MTTNARVVAVLAIGVLATTALTACGGSEAPSAADAAHGSDVAMTDVAQPDTAIEADATGGAPLDVIDGDGGCGCFPFDNQAAHNQAVITTSLECFSIHALWNYEYDAYAADPCIGFAPMNGMRREDIYADRNLIGVWSMGSGRDSMHGYFYDATTKALVGAVRAAAWMGRDPASCSMSANYTLTRFNRVRAGILPDCDFSGGWVSCPATSSRQMCPVAPDGGATDAAPDGASDGGDADGS